MLLIKRVSWFFVALIGIGTLLSGCDNTLDPFAEDTGLYSIYGYLSFSGSNFIRVKDLNTPPTSDSTRSLDATVRLENLETGTTETLIDSVVVFDGVYTHNFRMKQPVVRGATYRLTVERADGRRTRATATMPRGTLDVEPSPSDTVDCSGEVLLHLRNARKLSTVTLSVAVSWEDSIHWADQGTVDQATGFVPWRIVQQALPNHVLNTIDDREAYCTLLDEHEFRIAYTHYGPDWPADSVLTDPTASRIENGLGVFGGFRRDTLSRFVYISE